MADDRLCRNHIVTVDGIIRTSACHFIPAIGHLEPQPMLMDPGLPPARNSRLAGIGVTGLFTWVASARAQPKVAELRTFEEKTCVSRVPKVWARIGSSWINSGFGCGVSLSPSLIV